MCPAATTSCIPKRRKRRRFTFHAAPRMPIKKDASSVLRKLLILNGRKWQFRGLVHGTLNKPVRVGKVSGRTL